MGMIGNPHDFLILTNNPLVVDCLDGRGDYTIEYHPELDHRAVLVKARDLIHKGHILYTHPLAGSVKPNETPYKSLIVSLESHGMESESADGATCFCKRGISQVREQSKPVAAPRFALFFYAETERKSFGWE